MGSKNRKPATRAVPANKQRGERSFTAAGANAKLRFNLDGIFRLKDKYGKEYFKEFLEDIERKDPEAMNLAFELALTGADAGVEFPFGVSFEECGMAIRDAFCLMMHGRTWDEQIDHEGQQLLKDMEAGKTNPIRAARAFRTFQNMPSPQDSEPGSIPTGSGEQPLPNSAKSSPSAAAPALNGASSNPG